MTRRVRIIGAPMDYGANRRGVDMGPSAIRYAGLADQLATTGLEVVDDGDLWVPRAEAREPKATQPKRGRALFLEEIETICSRLADRVASALEAGDIPLVLGGDHSVAIGSIHGSACEATIGVVWLDAHADSNTPETSPSGNIHGMPLAATLGKGLFGDLPWAHAPGVREQSVAYVGLRSVDESEREVVNDSETTAFTMSDIDERGITAVIEDAIDVAADGTDGIHISLDLDWLDPQTAPGVGTPVRGGVTYREAHAALEAISQQSNAPLRSMDLVEVNPVLDEANETAALATELAASAFGKRIL